MTIEQKAAQIGFTEINFQLAFGVPLWGMVEDPEYWLKVYDTKLICDRCRELDSNG